MRGVVVALACSLRSISPHSHRSACCGGGSGSPSRSPRWVHRDLPRSAPPDSWRSLRCARVPPVDYRDELRPCQPVHHVPEHLFTISPVGTASGRGGIARPCKCNTDPATGLVCLRVFRYPQNCHNRVLTMANAHVDFRRCRHAIFRFRTRKT